MALPKLLVGITGSIAATKTIELINLLSNKYEINIICTQEGLKYIDNDSYKKYKIYDSWDNDTYKSPHIELSRWAEEFIIYPATANTIAKISNGIADDLLSTTVLMYKGRVKIFPAMHEEMFLDTHIQNSLSNLLSNHDVYGPRYGALDIGDEGLGRMLEPSEAAETILDTDKNRVFVISGPTREQIDDIRFITNASSGIQGYSLAIEASARGYKTTLVSSIMYKNITNIDQHNFNNTSDLKEILDRLDLSKGYLFMPAAISDFVTSKKEGKLDRRKGNIEIILSPNEDIIKDIKMKNKDLICVGFSAQLDSTLSKDKLVEKNLDYLVINDVSNPEIGFGSNDNKVTILNKNNDYIDVPKNNKFIISKYILDYVIPK